jgi:membrane protease YdiL (CAAX protease family)
MSKTVIFGENAVSVLLLMFSVFIVSTWTMLIYPNLQPNCTFYLTFLLFTFLGYFLKYGAFELPYEVIDLGEPQRIWVNASLGFVVGFALSIPILVTNIAKLYLFPLSITEPVVLILVCVIGPIIEELFFGGWLYPTFSLYFSRPVGMFATAFVFAFYHVYAWGTIGLGGFITPFIMRLILNFLIDTTDSLTAAITTHMTVNFIISMIALLVTAPLLGG